MNRNIPDEIVDEIRRRCDIVDVVGAVVQLKRAGGGTWKGLCPFHHEKTPSFTVNRDRGHYHCFGCGVGGDVFRFVMDREGVDFPNAIHLLASRCGVVIPENVSGGDPGERKVRADQRERLYRINEEFASFFTRALFERPNSPAAAYLEGRGIPAETARQFRLGYCPPERDALRQFGNSLGFSDAELVCAGILRRKEENGELYTLFRDRLTFAIWNETGKVVGFSARAMSAEFFGGKYINTGETPVFKKGELLYALPFARTALRAEKTAILCEGQLDTIAFHRAGIGYAVAPQGTAFTPDQAQIVRRYAETVLLAFDADGAGQEAIRKALLLLLPLELDVKVLRIPGGKDPDELFRSGGPDALRNAVANAVGWLDWRCDRLATEFDLTSIGGRSRATDAVSEFLKLIRHPVQLELSIRRTAERLRLSEDAVRAALKQLRRTESRRYNGSGASSESVADAPVPARRDDGREQAELALLELVLRSEAIARVAADRLPPEKLGDGVAARALNLVFAAVLEEEWDGAAARVEALLRETPDCAVSRALLLATEYREEDLTRAADDCIERIHTAFLLAERRLLREEMQQEKDPKRQMELLIRLQSPELRVSYSMSENEES